MKILIHSEPIDIGSLRIKKENIVKALGIPDNKADSYLLSLIDELLNTCLSICKPVASASVYEMPQFSKSEATMTIGGATTFNLDRVVLTALQKSTSIAFFTGTCGEETGKYSSELIRDGHALEGLIVDLAGSEIAEEVAENIHGRIASDMAVKGLRVTNRYSPGYCSWPVSDQQKLFSLLKGNTAGIHLTDSSLMIPIKSVSGVIGIGPDVIFRGYTCNYCEMDQCVYRNRK